VHIKGTLEQTGRGTRFSSVGGFLFGVRFLTVSVFFLPGFEGMSWSANFVRLTGYLLWRFRKRPTNFARAPFISATATVCAHVCDDLK